MQFPRITLIGFGEAGQAFASGWNHATLAGLSTFDLRFQSPVLKAAAHALNVELCPDFAVALSGADAVFCLVTADQAVHAARTAASVLPAGALWLDGNSCSPGAKRDAAAIIEAAGGRYVDLAIMAPVHPRRHKTPCLISGPRAQAATTLLDHLGMVWQIAGGMIGEASSIKMLRSVMIKGFEALTAECLLAARLAGVEEAVLSSLQGSDPGWNWHDRSSYNLERMMVHGTRRAAEMREVAATLRELGLPDAMAHATAGWQDRLADLGLEAGNNSLTDRADRILGALKAREP